MVSALVKLFLECGGEIQYNSEAEAIQVYNGSVTGVRLTDNSIRMADYVISDADTVLLKSCPAFFAAAYSLLMARF